MTACATIFNRYYRAPKRVVSASGPTVLLLADYTTDTLLQAGDIAMADGERVDKWTMATGGEWNYALANAAGALSRPTYIAASGVHTDGESSALTVATPVTIPADTDCDIWAKVSRASAGGIFHILGKSSTAGAKLFLTDDNNFALSNGTGAIGNNETYTPVTGVTLLRLGRTAGVWTYIDSRNGAVTLTGALAALAISFDTLLAYSSTGSGLDNFSDSGQFLQALRIATYPDGYADRATYRSAYETAINGAPL